MPINFTITPDMAIGIANAWVAIRRQLASEAGAEDMTDADALVQLKARAARIRAKGDAWEEEHPQQPGVGGPGEP